MKSIPATIDLNPSGDVPQASVIWMHGLGADGQDFVPIVERFAFAKLYKVRFVFPHAPIRAVTINKGMRMRAWYDIKEYEISKREDVEGVKDSAELVELLIEREIALNIPPHRIILGGFSQGGALALFTGLRYSQSLGGIIALSTYIPAVETCLAERSPANQKTPIFMAHGLYDPIVPFMLGEMSRQQLETLGYKIDWHSYSMPHSVLPEEITDVGQFLMNILSKQ